MPLLSITDLYYRVADRPIIFGHSLGIDGGQRHALIGTNGTGMSESGSSRIARRGDRASSEAALMERMGRRVRA